MNAESGKKKNMELTFASELYRVKKIIGMILLFLDDNLPKLAKEDRFDLKLIFSELLCNAVIHGNKMDASKNVHLFIEISECGIFSSITDEGPGFDHKRHFYKLRTGERNNSESGRGIKLVGSLTDVLDYNASGNQIKFYKRVNIDGQSPDC